jgi:putative ABC transport system permease protein
MNKLIFANLIHRPLRSIISILAVAIEVVMILSIVGIFMGMLNDQKQRTNGIGADLMMRPSNTSTMNGVSGAPMSAKLAGPLRKLPHVEVVSPAIMNLSTVGNLEILFGIDYETFNALKPFVFLSGGPFAGPNDVIIDDVLANSGGNILVNGVLTPSGGPLRVGDSIPFMGHPFRVSGIVEAGKGGRKAIPIDTMGALMGADGKASIFYIKCDDPANQKAVIKEIHDTPGLENYPVQTMDEWNSQMTPAKIPGFNVALEVVIGIAVIVGFLVIFQSMYTAVLERTREIGILKSMGASKMTVVGVVMRECAVLAMSGVLVGIVGTFGVRLLIAHVFPSQHFEITGAWVVNGAFIAFAGALCGALYPAWMASRKDPIDALAYE